MALVPIEGEVKLARNTINNKIHVVRVTSAGIIDLGEPVDSLLILP